MASSTTTKLFRVGRSILGGLGNNSFGAASSFSEMTHMKFLCQQHRSIIDTWTKLKVVDNSGATSVMCIQSLKGWGWRGPGIGDKVVVSVKEAQDGGKVKEGEVHYSFVVRVETQFDHCDGSEVKFDDNSVVLVDEQGELIGTKVFGPVAHELRKKKHMKILSLAEHIA